ncbi:MAG: molybdopterin molybdotransferase MoeA, partial [Gammaproteobacteria bacterium]|nr:molybdopterin molybdotransferase MoeA [Gammaproteobacteria bacterium]
VSVADLTADAESTLPIGLRVCAGDPLQTHQPGTVSRIFTGAPVPEGADAVIPQELCEVEGDTVRLPAGIKQGANIRRRGEDITKGAVVLQKGLRVRAQEMGMAATMGFAQLSVYRQLKVAVFSTGDELVALGEALGSGQIYDSNRYSVNGLLQTLGCEVIDLGCVTDNFNATQEILQQAAQQADLVITSGGVSVGEEDHIKAAVESIGQLNMWRLAIKPGKPLAYGTVCDTPFFGLPGNPVASFVTFCLFARPYLLRMQGMNDVAPLTISLPAWFDWPRSGKRREFSRARVVNNEKGESGVELYPHQGSGVLSSLVWANGLAVIPEGQTIERGDAVNFIPFDGLLS